MYEPPVRRLVIASAGFGLFYSVEARGIIIHALVHLSRSPETIRERIRRLCGSSSGAPVTQLRRIPAWVDADSRTTGSL
jgi:hypothetical protein